MMLIFVIAKISIIICKVVNLSDSNCYSVRDKLANIETLNLKKRNIVTIIIRFHYPYVVLMLNSFGQTVRHFELRKDFMFYFSQPLKKTIYSTIGAATTNGAGTATGAATTAGATAAPELEEEPCLDESGSCETTAAATTTTNKLFKITFRILENNSLILLHCDIMTYWT